MAIRASICIRIGLILIFIVYSQTSYNPIIDIPYNVQNGFTTFRTYCSHCHGVNKQGSIGPSLLNIRKQNIQFIIDRIKKGGDSMPQFSLNGSEIANIIGYLLD